MSSSLTISHFQTRALREAHAAGRTEIEVSPDLGKSTIPVQLDDTGVNFSGGGLLTWEMVNDISAAENSCFTLDDSGLRKISRYSELTDLTYSLMPTPGAPTMLVSGIPMHRIKGTDPGQDTLEKIESVKPVGGQVLDTATGLGYTAIQAIRSAQHVTTIEIDPTALEIARLNPWSRQLFENPNITQVIGDSFDILPGLEAGKYSLIIHDPPVFSLAGHLYSLEFYTELFRVLQPRGRVFHYIGNPDSKSGAGITRGAVKRLKQAGFRRIREARHAFGVVAYK